MSENIEQLPLFPYLDQIAGIMNQSGLLLLSAEPGAGKTTLVPWKLVQAKSVPGKIYLLEPRRLAARTAAERIAAMLDEKLGQSVGLRTRHDSIEGARLEVMTEGVLIRMLQSDPGLTGCTVLIFDEFHERSLNADLGLALAWDARKVLRPDLQIVIMSATLGVEELHKAFGGFTRLEVPGRIYPVETLYRPPREKEKIWEGAERLVEEAWQSLINKKGGDILVFLPGYKEIQRTQELMKEKMPEMRVEILHGSMAPAEQMRVFNRQKDLSGRTILATNVAETSITLPGVKAVVDMGFARRVRFSARSGMDHWDTLPISKASADQRKGRAGRLGPGVCYRWWKESDYREPYSPPEMMEADLAMLVLETKAWGAGMPEDLTWVTKPSHGSVEQAVQVLKALGLLDIEGNLTQAGKAASGIGLQPRLANMVLSDFDDIPKSAGVILAALLGEEQLPAGNRETDLREHLAVFIRQRDQYPSLIKEAKRILRALRLKEQNLDFHSIDIEQAGRLLLKAYPDRAARRVFVEPGGDKSRWVLAGGRAAVLTGPLSREEYLVIAELDGGSADGKVKLAAPISRKLIESGGAGLTEEKQALDWNGWTPKVTAGLYLGRLLLKEKPGKPATSGLIQAAAMEKLKESGLRALPFSDSAGQFLARCRFISKFGRIKDWPDFSEEKLLSEAHRWLVPYGNWQPAGGVPVFTAVSVMSALENRLGWDNRRRLDELAPETFTLPSGSKRKLDYAASEVPVLAARLQEFFGCTKTPSLCGEPLLLHLLSPAGRPVQITQDLDGFWDRAYPQVKKELKGRYPRHHWPDDPRQAEPTARAKPRK